MNGSFDRNEKKDQCSGKRALIPQLQDPLRVVLTIAPQNTHRGAAKLDMQCQDRRTQDAH